jgi:hypothetical protein
MINVGLAYLVVQRNRATFIDKGLLVFSSHQFCLGVSSTALYTNAAKGMWRSG